MSTLGVKIKVNAFEGEANIHGTVRPVMFAPAITEGGEVHQPSELTIRGLTVDDAIHVLVALEGGLLKGTDGANAAVTPDTPKPAEKKAEPKKEAAKPPKVIEAKGEEKKVEPKPAPKPAPVEVVDVSADIEDDLGDDVGDSEEAELDVAAMSKMEKLRPVIEHMISKGLKSVNEIVTASKGLIEQVPALAEVNAKGSFDKRIERAALVVMGDTQAS